MTTDDIIRMARESDIDPYDMCEDHKIAENNLERFAALVASAEREACAKVVQDYPYWLGMTARAEISNAIRARGQA